MTSSKMYLPIHWNSCWEVRCRKKFHTGPELTCIYNIAIIEYYECPGLRRIKAQPWFHASSSMHHRTPSVSAVIIQCNNIAKFFHTIFPPNFLQSVYITTSTNLNSCVAGVQKHVQSEGRDFTSWEAQQGSMFGSVTSTCSTHRWGLD